MLTDLDYNDIHNNPQYLKETFLATDELKVSLPLPM